ncbi:MAG: TonB-dependent receptor [Cytophagaceae bacterium]|nr:TonB-dependent receptor [Gemmatimonadaceae bacterium]
MFPSIAALEAKQPNRFTRTVPLAGRAPETAQQVLELGAYGQAEWQATEQVTVTGGLRWDATQFLTAAEGNRAVDQAFGVRTSEAPSDWLQFQPRAQVVWRPPSRRDVVRLGAGLFAGQVPYYAQHNQLLYGGSTLADVDLRGTATPGPDYIGYRADPTTVPGIGGAPPPPYVNVVGAFHTPRTLKGNLAWERQVVRGLVTTLGVQHMRGSRLYHYVDRNLAALPAFRVSNEGGRAIWVPASSIPAATGVTDVRRAVANRAFSRVIALESPGESRETAVTANAAFRLGARVQGSAGYAWSKARDNSTYGCCLARTATTFTPVRDDPRDLSQAWGPSDLDTRHRVVGTIDVRGPFGLTFAARYAAASGRPFSLVVDGDVNGDEANGNDLAFLFDPNDPATDAGVAASMRRVLANEQNLARAYIRDHLGRMAGRNTITTPWTHRVDVRARRDVALPGGTRVGFTVDVFNAGHLLNRNWGAQYALPVGISSQNPVVNRIPLLRIVGFDPATNRFRYTVNEQAGVLSRTGEPYQVQVGVRIDH